MGYQKQYRQEWVNFHSPASAHSTGTEHIMNKRTLRVFPQLTENLSSPSQGKVSRFCFVF